MPTHVRSWATIPEEPRVERCTILMPRTLPVVIALILIIGSLLAGCFTHARLAYYTDGPDYSAADLRPTLQAVDVGTADTIAARDAVEARTQMLAELRTHGENGTSLADVLTSQFPLDVLAVPVHIEEATYEGTPCWIVAEVWGEAGETLSHRRLWVISRDGPTVLAAQSMQ